MNLYFVHPATANIGNELIEYATMELLYEVFGAETNVVNVPALKNPELGGLVKRQIYDMNRLADAVVVGGGNLFENGQLSYDAQAVSALRPPMILLAISHGRIAAADGRLHDRTDSLASDAICHLVRRSVAAVVRDNTTQMILRGMGVDAEVGGCPTLFLPPNPDGQDPGRDVLISIRHPLRMSVPPELQWRIAEDLRRLIATLRAELGRPIRLACHDYTDLEFAAGFPDATPLYFGDARRCMQALRNCFLHVSYRLHGFLPCLAFGTHSIHLSYDERGHSMLETAGMAEWDIDLIRERDCISAVMDRVRSYDRYRTIRKLALPRIAELKLTTIRGLETLREKAESYRLAHARS